MKNAAVLLLRAACLLAACLCPAAAYDKSEVQNPKRPEVIDKKPDEKKPEGEKPQPKPSLVGTVKALAKDNLSFTLQPAPTKDDKKPAAVVVRIGKNTRITNGKDPGKIEVGQIVSVWLEDGGNVASGILVSKAGDKPKVKPNGGSESSVAEKLKARKSRAKPARYPAPIARAIDEEVDKHLAKEKIPASPQADDAEFLRRVTLDLTGRIPTHQRALAFLDSTDPDRRRKLIDELLDSPEFAEHFATVWNNLIVPRGVPTGKNPANGFLVWLAEQFHDNRGWDAIVTDVLTAQGGFQETPALGFLLANGENGQPQPNKVAASVARLFLGVNVGCAECHNHPFAHWKQSDFWGLAAFFGKLRLGAKNGPPTLTEASAEEAGKGDKKNGLTVFEMRGTAIVVPNGTGKVGGQAVKARYLGGDEATLDEKTSFRPRFAAWATSKDNPYFASAAVNRTWAHFFGRGFVNPLDGFDESNAPSNAALLRRLASEFAASGFDLKHLARGITTSKAYQRGSRPVEGNEEDETGFSRVLIKALTPEAFFDSVAVVMRGSTERQESREQFIRDFRPEESATDYTQGIPQQLRLMNAPLLNRVAPVVDRLSGSRVSREEAVTTLYLTALSRRPTAEEVALMSDYLARRNSDREGYRGVLWILMNSSEFALNR